MICDKCGMQNVDYEDVCANCAAPMPKKTKCGGFADILSFEGSDSVQPTVIQKNGEDDEIMKMLLKKTDNVIRQNDKNTRISTIAAGISVIVLVCSVAFGVMTMQSVEKAKDEIQATLKEIRTSINETPKVQEKTEEPQKVEADDKEKGKDGKKAEPEDD